MPQGRQQDLRGVLGKPWSGQLLRTLSIEQHWLVKDLIPPMGRFIMVAPAKTGKSILALQLAHCVASGIPFLGYGIEGGPTRVHYIDWEMGPVFMQDRMNVMADVYPGADRNIFVTMFPKDGVESAMTSVPNVGLFILDPIISVGYNDENDSAGVRRRLDGLATIAREQGAAIIIVHHARKASRDRTTPNMGLQEARGSGAFIDWMDGGIALRKQGSAGTFEMAIQLRGAPEREPLRLERDPTTLLYGIADEPFTTVMAECTQAWQAANSTLELPPPSVLVQSIMQRKGYSRERTYDLLRRYGYRRS